MEHRDLKSANVLLVVEGDGLLAKICDFGTAKWRVAMAPTSAGDKGSTAAWAAPETYRNKGKAGVFTEASDSWSFGMLIFEIVFLMVYVCVCLLMFDWSIERLGIGCYYILDIFLYKPKSHTYKNNYSKCGGSTIIF